jgi:hypothetical protein
MILVNIPAVVASHIEVEVVTTLKKYWQTVPITSASADRSSFWYPNYTRRDVRSCSQSCYRIKYTSRDRHWGSSRKMY